MSRIAACCLFVWAFACSACGQEPEPRELVVEKLAGGMGFTEGPVWLPAEHKLVFSDIPGSMLMEWSESGGLKEHRASEHPNGNLLDLQGRLLTCRHGTRDIVRTEADGTLTVLIERLGEQRLNSPNDLAVKSDGTIWFTDPPWGLKQQTEEKELGGHWVFRLDPERAELAVMLRDRTMPNGIAFSPDETRLYVADTGGHPSHPDPAHRERPATVTAYVVNEQDELASEPVWRIETRCDGMCVDVEGKLYTTAKEGVNVWSPKGEHVVLIPVPESPANVCFGGDEFTTLFITARTSLYRVELDVLGSRPPGATW